MSIHDDINYPVINTDNWLQPTGEKKAGVQMLTRVPDDINGMAVAYFKYPPEGQNGPVSANEYICSKIGRKIGLPTAKVQFREFDGKHGVLSFLVDVEPTPWNQVPTKIKNAMPLYFYDFKLLAKMLVFDVFINNIDRHGDNFMISRVSPQEEKYKFHLIDHGHALLGPSAEHTQNTFNFNQHIMLQELNELKTKGIKFFNKALKDVTDLSEMDINQIIDQVPDTYLTNEDKIAAKSMLLERQQKIYNEFSMYIGNI